MPVQRVAETRDNRLIRLLEKACQSVAQSSVRMLDPKNPEADWKRWSAAIEAKAEAVGGADFAAALLYDGELPPMPALPPVDSDQLYELSECG